MKKRIKLIIVLVVLGCLFLFLIASPIFTFRKNEKLVENAAREYFELHSRELPTGERVKTVSLKDLYYDKFLEEDIYIPYSKKNCSLDNSWVKVKKVNGNYEYYTYLDCGIMKSSIDAKGPTITLNDSNSISLNLGEEYKEPGVKSVVDEEEGNLKVEDVVIKGKVDTSKIGTYEITYTAFDSFNNKTVVTREVKVVQKLYNTIKKALGEANNFTGEPTYNYVRLSNMMFRIYGVDDNKNVIIVSDEDVANVNYSKIDKWLKYYYNHLNSKTKKMIVASKYCNMKVDENNLSSVDCSSYTGNKKVYIPSIVEVNKAQAGDENFMKTSTMSWVSNAKSDKEAYLTRSMFYFEEYGKSFLAYSTTDNYGIRPMMVVKGSSLIGDGDGSKDKPFTFGDSKAVRGGSSVSECSTGEYIEVSGILFRVVDVMKDGTVKVISNTSIGKDLNDLLFFANPESDKITYDPTDKSSVAYAINNKASKYIDTSQFIEHEIEVPIYKKKIIYGEEISTKKYNVVLSAPNMYEMFSAQPASYTNSLSLSYWLLNTSQANRIGAAIYDMGVPVNEEIAAYDKYGVRVVGYLKNNVLVQKGNGTPNNPYSLK